MKISSQEFVKVLFTFQLELKMYHWKTCIYARHKASDKLIKSLLNFVDLFVESFMGKFERVKTPKEIYLRTDITDKNVISKLMNPFICFLKKWKKDLENNDELINLIEEIQTQTEKTKYLMTLR